MPALRQIQTTPGWVSLTIFDADGRHRQTLLSGQVAAGTQSVNLAGPPAGVYLARLRCSYEVITTRLIFLP